MATWATYASPAVTFILDMIAVGADTFVGVGDSGSVIRSDDGGQNWTTPTSAEANSWHGLAFNGSRVVAVSSDGANRVMTSDDGGQTWTSRAAAEANDWNAVTYSSALGLFIAVASSGANRVMTSADGETWAAHAAASASSWAGVAAGDDVVVAVSVIDGISMVSANGTAWSAGGTFVDFVGGPSVGSNIIQYSSSADVFACGGTDNVASAKVALSEDGVTWTYEESAPLSDYFVLSAVVAADAIGGFIGPLPVESDLTPSPTIIGISEDGGETWTAEDSTFSGSWISGAWDNDTGTVIFWDATSGVDVLVGTFDIGATVTDVSPSHGDAAGGDVLTLTGTGFTGKTIASFNGTETTFTPSSDTSGTCISPAHAVGEVTVTVS